MKARNKILLHYDAILFDVDGTLIDSAPGIIHTLKRFSAPWAWTSPASTCAAIWARPLRKSFGEHFTDPAKIEKATRLYRESYAVKGSHECAAYSGALEMLQTLKDAGLSCALLPPSPPRWSPPSWKKRALHYFDFIGGASMDESRDTKTDVVRYVLSQPACRASGC